MRMFEYYCAKLMNMQNTSGAGGRGIAERRSPHNLIFEEIVPSSGWTEDSDCRCLIIDLPGFKRDGVKLQVDNYGHLLVSGERQVNDMKHIRFEQSYRVPDNSNIEDTTAKFEDDILYIIVPKKAAPENEDNRQTHTAQADDHVQGENQQNELHKDEALDHDEDKLDNHQRTDQEGLSEGGEKQEEEEEEEEEEKPEEGQEEEAEELDDAKKENEWKEKSLWRILRVQLKKNKGIFVTAVLAFSLGVLVSQKFQTNPEI